MISSTKIKLGLYETSVTLYVASSMEEFEAKMRKKTKNNNLSIKDTYGVVFGWGSAGDAGYVIALHESNLSHNLIAHEIFHLAIMITNDIDIEDEESQAWLVGYLTESVYSILKKKNFVIKEK